MNAAIALPNVQERFGMLTEYDLLHCPTGGLRIYGILKMHAGNKGYCTPSILTLMEKSGLSQSQVYRQVATLRTQGWLEGDESEGWTLTDFRINADNFSHKCERPTSNKRKSENTYREGATKMTDRLANITKGPEDDQPPKQKPAPVSKSPRRKALLELADYYNLVTRARVTIYEGSQDMRILGQLYDEYQADAKLVIEEAFKRREELASDQYPKFTLHTVWFFAKFKYVPQPKIDIATLIERNTENGVLNEHNLAASCVLYGVCGDELQGPLPRETWQRVSDKIAFIDARKRSRTATQVPGQDVS